MFWKSRVIADDVAGCDSRKAARSPMPIQSSTKTVSRRYGSTEFRPEGWSFDVDVFDPTALVNDPADPWSGNNAISHLMFHDKRVFQENVPGFEILHDRFTECIMFPLSGGVTAKTKAIELPTAVLKIIDWIDGKLCRLSPKIFAMGRSVVLRKRACDEAGCYPDPKRESNRPFAFNPR
jgi:hypothetical protein